MKIFQSNKELDLEKLIDSRMLIFANSGAGKSYTARKILEESNNKVMSIVIDIEGEFKTLREKYDFLLIGEDGDVPLNLKSAKILPKKLLELNVPTIIDISELKNRERIKFVKEFLESLMELPRQYWKPCLIFLDEAHRLAGQQEKQDSTWAVIDLMTRGRKRGYCGILLSQRISKLHKDAVAECGNYIAGRTNLDLDMKRTADILGFTTKEQMLSLRDLEDGECFVFGRALSNNVEKQQVAPSKTTHPKRGTGVLEISKPTQKIKDILKKITDIPKEAEKEIKEVNDYRNEVVKLRKELSQRPTEQIIKEVSITDVKAIEKARKDGFRDAQKKYESFLKSLETSNRILKKDLSKVVSSTNNLLNSKAFSVLSDTPIAIFKPTPVPTIQRKEVPKVTQVTHVTKPPVTSVSDGDTSLSKCERTLYSLLLANPERGFTRVQLALLTGYSHKSGGFGTAISKLNILGLIRKEGSMIFIESIDTSLAEMGMEFTRDNLIKKLPKCPREILLFLIENSEMEFNKEEIANSTNYSVTSGGFGTAISKLNTLDLIKKNGSSIKLNPEVLEI